MAKVGTRTKATQTTAKYADVRREKAKGHSFGLRLVAGFHGVIFTAETR
jgi:hypothetical protein